jgi:heme-degrading monooxygenase HmoA
MPVTELVYFTATAGDVTPPYVDAVRGAKEVQDKWCEENLKASDPAAPATTRGAAMFQDLYAPSQALLTAHWDSAAQHGDWIASEANQGVFASVMEHIDPSKLTFFHVDGLTAFPDSEPEARVPTLKAPVVSVVRYFVTPENKAEFGRVFAGVRAVFDEYASPFVHRGGWRIEKESEDKEEFILIGGWESVEKAQGFAKVDGFKWFEDSIQALVTGDDVKYYKRCL